MCERRRVGKAIGRDARQASSSSAAVSSVWVWCVVVGRRGRGVQKGTSRRMIWGDGMRCAEQTLDTGSPMGCAPGLHAV